MTDIKDKSVSISRLDEMKGGWFIGSFFPTAVSTSDVEVAVQSFSAGYKGEAHHHKVSTEVTLLLSGEAVMADRHIKPGDIVTLSPGISSSFVAISDCKTVVVKLPGALNDKYVDEVI